MIYIKCDYCGKPAQLVTGEVIYPHRPDLAEKYFWMCDPCKAYVGTHSNSKKHHFPMGRLANKELRQWKKLTHAAFDPLWKKGTWTRLEAYQWLAKEMEIPIANCHIGMFTVQRCKAVIDKINMSWN